LGFSLAAFLPSSRALVFRAPSTILTRVNRRIVPTQLYSGTVETTDLPVVPSRAATRHGSSHSSSSLSQTLHSITNWLEQQRQRLHLSNPNCTVSWTIQPLYGNRALLRVAIQSPDAELPVVWHWHVWSPVPIATPTDPSSRSTSLLTLPPSLLWQTTQTGIVPPLLHVATDEWDTEGLGGALRRHLQSALAVSTNHRASRKLPKDRSHHRDTHEWKVRPISETIANDFCADRHVWGRLGPSEASSTSHTCCYGVYPDANENINSLIAVGIFIDHDLVRFVTATPSGGKNSVADAALSRIVQALVQQHPLAGSVVPIRAYVGREWLAVEPFWQNSRFVNTQRPYPPQVAAANISTTTEHCGGRYQLVDTPPWRPGHHTDVLPNPIREELSHCSTPVEAVAALRRHGLSPVYDSGVECWQWSPGEHTVASDSPVSESSRLSSYTVNNNTGIQALLDYAALQITHDRQPPLSPLDSRSETQIMLSWPRIPMDGRDGYADNPGELVYRTPSSFGEGQAYIEVRARDKQWRSVSYVSPHQHITHAVYRVHGSGRGGYGNIDASTVGISDYLRSITGLAITALEARDRGQKNNDSQSLRVLHFGFGAGTLLRYATHIWPDSVQVAVELDAGVVRAAYEVPLIDVDSSEQRQQVRQGDALKFSLQPGEARYDCILVDVFDDADLVPSGFYDRTFLKTLRDHILNDNGFVVHNMHYGVSAINAQVQEATAAYREVFADACRVASLVSTKHEGNMLLLATKFSLNAATDAEGDLSLSNQVQWLAFRGQERWGVDFDVPHRLRGVKPI
jgi:hypothetical protein